MAKVMIIIFLLVAVFISAESFIGEWEVKLYHIDDRILDGGKFEITDDGMCLITNSLSGEEEIREMECHYDDDFLFIGSSGYYFTWVDDNRFELIPAFDTVYYRLVFRRQSEKRD